MSSWFARTLCKIVLDECDFSDNISGVYCTFCISRWMQFKEAFFTVAPPPSLSFSDDNFPCIAQAGTHILAVHCQVFQISINTPYSAVASALKQEIGFHDICYSNIHRMQYLSGYYSKPLIDKCVYVHSYQKSQLLIFKKKVFHSILTYLALEFCSVMMERVKKKNGSFASHPATCYHANEIMWKLLNRLHGNRANYDD